MNVRAKFAVNEVRQLVGQSEIILTPVISDGSGDDVNKTWSDYTPSGNLNMIITNQAAAEQFKVGKSYYLDFSPAD